MVRADLYPVMLLSLGPRRFACQSMAEADPYFDCTDKEPA